MIQMIQLVDDIGILDGSFRIENFLTFIGVLGLFLLSLYLMVM